MADHRILVHCAYDAETADWEAYVVQDAPEGTVFLGGTVRRTTSGLQAGRPLSNQWLKAALMQFVESIGD